MTAELTVLAFRPSAHHAPDLIRGLADAQKHEVPGRARDGRRT